MMIVKWTQWFAKCFNHRLIVNMFASFLDEISTITDSTNKGNDKNEQNIFLGQISIDESSI